jgi:hypothetical protein
MGNEEQARETAGPESALGRVAGALMSPRATFDSLAEKPSWLLPLLLWMAVSVSVVFTYGHRVGWRGFLEKQDAQSSSYNQRTPQQQQLILERQVRFAPIGGYAGATVFVVVIALVVAGILLCAFNIVFGTTIRFKQAFGITAHAFLPGVVKGVIALIVLWVRPPEGIDLQNLVMSNVGAFLPATAPNWGRVLASSFDLFNFWILALLALGFTAAGKSQKLKVGSAVAIIATLWLIWVLAETGLMAMVS